MSGHLLTALRNFDKVSISLGKFGPNLLWSLLSFIGNQIAKTCPNFQILTSIDLPVSLKTSLLSYNGWTCICGCQGSIYHGNGNILTL